MTLAMKRRIEEEKKKKAKLDPKNLDKLSGIIKTKKNVKWSEEIDETLYGSFLKIASKNSKIFDKFEDFLPKRFEKTLKKIRSDEKERLKRLNQTN